MGRTRLFCHLIKCTHVFLRICFRLSGASALGAGTCRVSKSNGYRFFRVGVITADSLDSEFHGFPCRIIL